MYGYYDIVLNEVKSHTPQTPDYFWGALVTAVLVVLAGFIIAYLLGQLKDD